MNQSESKPTDVGDLEQAVAEMAELAGGLAHELRNPLSTILINLKLLREVIEEEGASMEDVRRRALLKIEVLRQEAARLQTLFDEFLSLVGPFRLQRKTADLRAIVERLVQFFEPLARGHKIDVRVEGEPAGLVGEVDEQLLSQALLNLVINAQQAMPYGGALRIRLSRDGAFGVIEVADTGVGIAESDRERVLHPFFSTKPGGTGLGLSITRRIIAEHGGTISFESVPGRGTMFTVRVPMGE